MKDGRSPAPYPAPDFLFVAGNVALDFVNTRPVLNGEPNELLTDFGAVLRWFAAAKLLDARSADRLSKLWAKTAESHVFWRQLLVFREQLRNAIVSIESGPTIPKSTLDLLNRQLSQHAMPTQLVFFNGKLRKQHRFQPQKPADLFGPLLEAAADLLTSFDPRRLRKCETCVLHFLDATKNATRRWCSMKLCGNRAKVAKYAARHRATSHRKR